MSASIILTGDKALDRALATFEAKVQKKYIRTALNNAVKLIERVYKRLVPVETGAMRDAVKRRTPKIRRGKGFGRSLVIDRDRLFALRKKRGGKIGQQKVTTKMSGVATNVDFFYPAVVELGDTDTAAQRPLRTALYGSEKQVVAAFRSQLRQAITEATRAGGGLG